MHSATRPLRAINLALFTIAYLLSLPLSVEAAQLTTGTWLVPEGASNFIIPLTISTGTGETLTDMSLLVQVADGGPSLGSIAGPTITGIDFTGSVWDATDYSVSPSPGLAVGDFNQLIGYDVSIAFGTGSPVPANGILASINIDATGYTAGQSFELKLVNTVGGDSSFLGAGSVNITNGIIQIIPEPSTATLFFFTFALVARHRSRIIHM
jgi:hypothetical protein